MREYEDRKEFEKIFEAVRNNIKEQITAKGVSMKGSAKGTALSEIIAVFDNMLSSTSRAIRKRQSSNNRIFRVGGMKNGLCFKKEISVPYSITRDGYIAVFEDGPIIITAIADNITLLKREFEKEVLDSWEYYAEEDDDKLAAGAIEVKNWLQDSIIKG